MICAWCKKEFTPAYDNSKYCSDECTRKAGNFLKRKRKAIARGMSKEEAEVYAREVVQLRTCARFGCGNQFIPKVAGQKYCCDLCAKKEKQEELRRWRRNKKKYAAYRMDKPIFVNKLIRDLHIKGA